MNKKKKHKKKIKFNGEFWAVAYFSEKRKHTVNINGLTKTKLDQNFKHGLHVVSYKIKVSKSKNHHLQMENVVKNITKRGLCTFDSSIFSTVLD